MTKEQVQKGIEDIIQSMDNVDNMRVKIIQKIVEEGYDSSVDDMKKDYIKAIYDVAISCSNFTKEVNDSVLIPENDRKGIINMIAQAHDRFTMVQRISQLEYVSAEKANSKIIKVNYHKEDYPELEELQIIDKGDFIDLRAAESVELKQGEFKLISLGISAQLPKGYYAEVVPRSSTYKNFGIIMTNSIGIIDESYCGDGDIWKFPALAMRDTSIKINDRIAQFRLVKKSDIKIIAVDELGNEDRGGIGSTGTNEIKTEEKEEVKAEDKEREEKKDKFTVIK